MDYREEQNNEIEALDSIYCGDLEILGAEPHRFCIRIKSEEHEDDSEEGLACTLKFTYTPKYPDDLPELEILDPDNFRDDDEEELMKHIIQQGEENLGMAMVFTLISAAQEWLNCKWDKIKQDRELEAEKRLKEVEEEERKRFEGTRVTVETFMAWKKAFEEELGINRKSIKDEKEGKKLTGRELFLQDQTLIESDLKFLEEGGEAVKVDESLFQDLDELDLDETEFSDD